MLTVEETDPDIDMIEDEDLIGIRPKRKKKRQETPESIKARAAVTRERHILRRALSEQHMNEILDWHLQEGCAYHIISGGDIDSLTFLRGIVKQQHIRYCIVSSWVFAMEDAEEMADWLAKGYVDRIDVYTGELTIQHYAGIFDYLERTLPQYGGRIISFRNHCKVMVFYGDEFSGAIESSSNVNTNPRTEQTCITVDRGLADFYKKFFDDVDGRERWPYEWHPWEASV